jgi:hypothetical protein
MKYPSGPAIAQKGDYIVSFLAKHRRLICPQNVKYREYVL